MIQHFQIGQYKDIHLELVTWDAVKSEAALSCACLFQMQINHSDFVGGLKHLDVALNHQLKQMISKELFTAEFKDFLLLNDVDEVINGQNIMLIGMGNPKDFLAERMHYAIKLAFKIGQILQIKSVSIAPSILDTDLEPPKHLDRIMLQALKNEIDHHEQLALQNLVKPNTIERFIFDAGEHDFEIKAQGYLSNFNEVFND